jgi:hypothetical protein
MTDALAADATILMKDWSLWRPMEEVWGPLVWPPRTPVRDKTNPNEIHHLVWLAIVHLSQEAIMILISDLLLEYARSQHASSPSPSTSASLERATDNQLSTCDALRASVAFHIEDLTACKTAARTMGALSLLWPLSTLLGLKTTTKESYEWCAEQAAKIADVFNLRMAKVMGDMMEIGAKVARDRMERAARASP